MNTMGGSGRCQLLSLQRGGGDMWTCTGVKVTLFQLQNDKRWRFKMSRLVFVIPAAII